MFKALLDYRNTPLNIGFSPGHLFLNPRLKTSAPLLKPLREDAKKLQLKSLQLKNKIQFDKHSGSGLESLKAGDAVFLYTEGNGNLVKSLNSIHYLDPTLFCRQMKGNCVGTKDTFAQLTTVLRMHCN